MYPYNSHPIQDTEYFQILKKFSGLFAVTSNPTCSSDPRQLLFWFCYYRLYLLVLKLHKWNNTKLLLCQNSFAWHNIFLDKSAW